MKNGQEIFEELSKMTEEERRQCAYVCAMDKMTLGIMMDNVRNSIDNNYDKSEDAEWLEAFEEAKQFTTDEIASAIEKAEVSDDLQDQLFDLLNDSLVGIAECKIPVCENSVCGDDIFDETEQKNFYKNGVKWSKTTVRFPKEIVDKLNCLMTREGDVSEIELNRVGIWHNDGENRLRFHMSRSVIDFRENFDAGTEIFAEKNLASGGYSVRCLMRWGFKMDDGIRKVLESDTRSVLDGEWKMQDPRNNKVEIISVVAE